MANENNHDSKMMWLMAICCALPLVILLLSKGLIEKYGWVAIGAIGIFLLCHFFLMRKGYHGVSSSKKEEHNKSNSDNEKKDSCR